MKAVCVTIWIKAPQPRVFETVSDHATFLSGPKSTCWLARPGASEPNGVGAVREVRLGPMIFTEEITAFDRPRRFDYVITQLKGASGPLKSLQHAGGSLCFESERDSTKVEWHSRFTVPTPVVGWLLEHIVGWRVAGAFREMLEQAKRRLE